MRGAGLTRIPESGFLPLSDVLIDPAEVFGRKAPLCVEVGSGNGHFLAEMAARHPDNNYIGIDLRGKRIEKSCRKVKNREITNLRFIHGDAFVVLETMLEPASLEEVYVNFPDPWPKYRHRRNRLNSRPFIGLLSVSLRPGGKLYWVCDFYPQVIEVIGFCRELEKTGSLKNHFGADGLATTLDHYLPTQYEKKWREMDRPIFYVCFEKI